MSIVTNCLIINLDYRTDLWDGLSKFRTDWELLGNKVVRIPGVNYKNKTNVINEFILSNKINLNGGGFRKKKKLF